MSKLAKLLIIAIFMMAVSISYVSIAKAWQCPCNIVICDDDTIYADFCLKPPHDAYYFWYYIDELHSWSYVLLEQEEINPCESPCLHYTSAIPWDCEDEFEWQVTDGNPGTIVDTDGPCHN
jgi:hypothetical protein